MRATRPTLCITILLAMLLATPFAAYSDSVVLNHFGFVYETGGFPTSIAGDTLTGLGVVTFANPSISCDFATSELTWIIRNLVSEGETSPDGGRTLITSYTGGTIGLYCDGASNHDWGINPPNASAPSSFEDGDPVLIGAFSQFTLVYDTVFKVGAYQGVVSFTSGTNLANLPEPNGLVFAGTISPDLDPNVPAGYDLESVGQIVAPALCSLTGNVAFTFNPATCEKCKGVTELVLDYSGAGDINSASVDKGNLAVAGGQIFITPETGKSKLASNIVVTVGSDEASIHTSCSQPIDAGNTIGSFSIASVSKILVSCDEEKCDGVTRMVLLYVGTGDPNNVTVGPDATATVSGNLITILPTGQKLSSNTSVDIDGDGATIHTSCSQPLAVGFTFGDYEVVELDVLPGDPSKAVSPPSGPVVGATVDVMDNQGNVFTALTDGNGDYFFTDVAGETLRVSIDISLGYIPASETSVTRLCQAGGTAVADFDVVRVAIQDKPRSKGFWKKQVNSALKGKDEGVKHTGAELSAFLDEIHVRLDQHFDIFSDVNTLDDLKRVLEQKPLIMRKASQFDKARAQFMALLLNLVSQRLATWQFISEDNATVSQAITYIAGLLSDAGAINDAEAKRIAERIVKRKEIDAGVIPLSTPQIAFAPPAGGDTAGRGGPSGRIPIVVSSFANYPNPFNPVTTIRFELSAQVPVSFAVYNVMGQKVRDLVQDVKRDGVSTLLWDGKDNAGREVSSGVYFGRLTAGTHVTTRRMILIR